jgi:hypothetical protein
MEYKGLLLPAYHLWRSSCHLRGGGVITGNEGLLGISSLIQPYIKGFFRCRLLAALFSFLSSFSFLALS